MNKTTWTALIVIVAIIIIGGLTFVTKPKPASGEPIKIGIASLLSGDFAVVGENILATAQLAVAEVNAKGGINGRPLVIDVQDAGCDSKTGLNAVQKLVNTDGVKYILAGMCSNGTIAAAPLANQNHVVMLTPVTGGKNVDEAGDYIFRIANSDILAGQDLAESMLKLGYKNVGVVGEVTEYTADIQGTFQKTITAKGGSVVVSEQFPSNTTDFRTLVTKVKSAKPQALLILSQTGTNAANFIKQSKQQGLDVPVFTDFTLASNGTVKEILGSLDCIYFADPAYSEQTSATKSFFAEYQEKYGHAPSIPFHTASTYDGIMMLVSALRAEGDDSVKVQQWLSTNVKNYHGLMGTYSLDAQGNSDLGFTVRVIKNGVPTNITY